MTHSASGRDERNAAPGDPHLAAVPKKDGDWDRRYASADQVWSGRPNGALIAAVGDQAPGRALDVGCGEGADAIWLAQHGWDVLALDVSAVALQRAQRAALESQATVKFLHAGLLEAVLPAAGFDLVSVQYPALLRTPDKKAESALLDAVAPRGTLLVVHHADVDVERAKAHGFDPESYVSHEDLLAMLGPGWRIQIAERRPRHVVGGGGSHHGDDLVLKASRSA
ncbi:MAG: methyltransferase type 11 [Micrococcaceae bacterium]|nr:methyltransferase type 11 [Micrococcaceae bacterium]